MLPSTIDANGQASLRQHLLSIIVDDRVAIDAGCLAMACSDIQREQIRDIVLTHTHLDHIAGLPLFIDDLFSSLTEPIRIHATRETVEILERDLFNWAIYPRFSELKNDHGPVLNYCEFERGSSFDVAHLKVRSVAVNHEVSASGYIVSDGDGHVVITGDTAETDEIWQIANELSDIKAVLVECAFPDELGELAHVSNHLTPGRLLAEMEKLTSRDYPVYVINIKPAYRQRVIDQITGIGLQDVHILEIGKAYQF